MAKPSHALGVVLAARLELKRRTVGTDLLSSVLVLHVSPRLGRDSAAAQLIAYSRCDLVQVDPCVIEILQTLS